MLAEGNVLNTVKTQRVVIADHLLCKEPIGIVLLASFHNLQDKALWFVDQQTSIGIEIVKQSVIKFYCGAVYVKVGLRLLGGEYPSNNGNFLILTVVVRGGLGNSDSPISDSLAQPRPWQSRYTEEQAHEKDEDRKSVV